MKTTENYAQWFVNECARAARAGHACMMRDPFAELHLYYKRGRLALFGDTDSKEGYSLGDPVKVPGNLTVEQLTGWVHARAARLDCLP